MGSDDQIAWAPRPGVVVRHSWPWDAWDLAPWLRSADKEEIRLCSGRPALTCLASGIENSDQCYTLLADDRVHAIFGVRKQTDTFGIIWLLGSPWISDHPRIALEGARHFLPLLSQDFQMVGNVIHSKQALYLRFLQKLGFYIRKCEDAPTDFLLFTGEFNHV